MDKCLSLEKKTLKNIAKKMSYDYRNKTKREVCNTLLNDYYIDDIEIVYLGDKSLEKIKKYINIIINSFIKLNLSIDYKDFSFTFEKNKLKVLFKYKIYTKNDPYDFINPIEKFKIRIKGIKYKFYRQSFFINYIRPFENAHLKILNKPGTKSNKSSIPSFKKMPIISNLNIDRPLDSNVYYNISSFLKTMKFRKNEKGENYIPETVCIVDINQNNEFMYNVDRQSFYNIEYLINSIKLCFRENKLYIAIPFIFAFTNIKHATGLFIDTVRKKVEYFDSLDHTEDYYYFIILLEKYLKYYFPDLKWMHKITYMDLDKKDHFLQNTIDVWGGACVLYTTIFLTMRCIYPKMSLKHVKLYFDKAKSKKEKENILKKFSNFVFNNNKYHGIMKDFDILIPENKEKYPLY